MSFEKIWKSERLPINEHVLCKIMLLTTDTIIVKDIFINEIKN
jgi:hypothetical protein